MGSSVVPTADIELAGPGAHFESGVQVEVFDFIRVLLDEGVGVLGESAGRGEEQTLVRRALCQEALHQLQAEGHGGFHQFGIVVRGESRSSSGQGVSDHVHGHFLDRATCSQAANEESCGQG